MHERLLLPNKGKPNFKNCMQNKVMRAVLQREACQDLISHLRIGPRQSARWIYQGGTFALNGADQSG